MLLSALLVFAGTDHRYAELPDPQMRVGLPPGYDFCEASPRSQAYYNYLICDHHRELEFPERFAARYYVWIFTAETSSALGYDPRRGVESIRERITESYFANPTLSRLSPDSLPSLAVTPLTVDGREALEFVSTRRVSVDGEHPETRLTVIGLDDGRLIQVFNQPDSPISSERDATNFREIIRGIRFHEPN